MNNRQGCIFYGGTIFFNVIVHIFVNGDILRANNLDLTKKKIIRVPDGYPDLKYPDRTVKLKFMELKKSLKADLQPKKALFFEIGMIISLLATIICFAWSQSQVEEQIFAIPMGGGGGPISETPPITREQPKGATQPTKKVQQSMDIIKIVLNETEITTEIDFSEFDMDAIFADATAVGPMGVTGGAGDGNPFGDNDIIGFDVIEETPKFMGKDLTAFQPWVQARVQYPDEAIRQKIQGRVNVTFVIEKDGTLSGIEASGNPILVAEAVKVIKTSPKWTPGRQRNRPARVKFQIQVLFQFL